MSEKESVRDREKWRGRVRERGQQIQKNEKIRNICNNIHQIFVNNYE